MASRIKLPTRKRFAAPEDYGFFGPGSITWKVWGYPTSLTVGFQRSVVVEELDPDLVAAVEDSHGIYDRPRTRYDRTLRYFALVAFGDTRTTSKAADVLVKVHSKAVGREPYSGHEYDANNGKSQLWIHLTAWHSILYAYERYGPGRLTLEEEAQYWRECAIAAELQTFDPADVPRSRDAIREYFEAMRPQLVGSELARKAMQHLLHAEVMLPPVPFVLRPIRKITTWVLAKATIATMPQWMRELGGVKQARFTDALVRPVMRVAMALAALSKHVELLLLGYLSPSTVSVVAPRFLGIEPVRAEVLTPAEARARYGYARPADAHHDLRAEQRDRALSGERPSDEGIVESVPVLGATA